MNNASSLLLESSINNKPSTSPRVVGLLTFNNRSQRSFISSAHTSISNIPPVTLSNSPHKIFAPPNNAKPSVPRFVYHHLSAMSASPSPTPSSRDELMFLGTACHHRACNLHDFLPFYVSSQGVRSHQRAVPTIGRSTTPSRLANLSARHARKPSANPTSSPPHTSVPPLSPRP